MRFIFGYKVRKSPDLTILSKIKDCVIIRDKANGKTVELQCREISNNY